jgi:hypothetical protein
MHTRIYMHTCRWGNAWSHFMQDIAGITAFALDVLEHTHSHTRTSPRRTAAAHDAIAQSFLYGLDHLKSGQTGRGNNDSDSNVAKGLYVVIESNSHPSVLAVLSVMTHWLGSERIIQMDTSCLNERRQLVYEDVPQHCLRYACM